MRRILDLFFPLGTKRRNFLFNMKQRCRRFINLVRKGKKDNIASNAQGNGRIYDKY